MNKKLIAIMSSAISIAVSSPALASPHFFNAGDEVSAIGLGRINDTECVAEIKGVVGPSLGLPSPHSNHSDRITGTITNIDGPFPCSLVEFDFELLADGSVSLWGNSVINSICLTTSAYGGPGTVTIHNNSDPATQVDILDFTYGICALDLEEAIANAVIWHN